MGILNLTPDSFSDGGRLHGVDGAVRAAGRMLAQGADLLDLGGQSTRPGAEDIGAEREISRVLPVLQAISRWGNAQIEKTWTPPAWFMEKRV